MFDPAELRAAYAPPVLGSPERPGGADQATWLRMNFISSIDGAVTLGGKSGGLNDPWDLQVFLMLRAQADLVLVGAGTLRDEGYDGIRVSGELADWREQQGQTRHPRLGILTRSANLDPASPLFARPMRGGEPDPDWQRPLLLCPESADVTSLTDLVEVVRCSGADPAELDPRMVMAEAAQRGYHHILSEGGPHVFGSLLEADVVDEICLTISPLAVAGRAGRIAVTETEVPREFELTHALPGGKMLFLRYTRAR